MQTSLELATEVTFAATVKGLRPAECAKRKAGRRTLDCLPRSGREGQQNLMMELRNQEFLIL